MINSKDEAMIILEITRGHLLDKARDVAERICEARGYVTTDDVRQAMAIEPGNNKWLGAVFKSDEWEKMGYVTSTVKTSHSRPILKWRLKRPIQASFI